MKKVLAITVSALLASAVFAQSAPVATPAKPAVTKKETAKPAKSTAPDTKAVSTPTAK